MNMIIMMYLSVLGIWDYREKRVPILLLIVGGALLLGVGGVRCVKGEISYIEILLGTLPGVIALFIAWVTGKVGYADGIVLVQLGVCMGYRKGVMVVCASMLLLSLCCIVLLCFKRARKDTKIPYFPFLAFSYLVWNL